MYQVSWLDVDDGIEKQVEFASWKFASQMTQEMQRLGHKNVRLKPIRRDVLEVNTSTMETWEVGRNRLLSQVLNDVKTFLSANPNASLLIVPPRSRRRSG